MFRLASNRSCLIFLLPALAFILLTASHSAAEDPPSAADSNERGLTTPPSIIFTDGWSDAGDFSLDQAPFPARPAVLAPSPAGTRIDSTWNLVDSKSFQFPIPAGEACAIRFSADAGSLAVILPLEPVIARAWLAIDYAPDWLGADLRDAFSRLDSADQDTLAGVILNAADPIVDEIAFVVAHTAPGVLGSNNLYHGLLVENAEYVYSHDQYLDYVEIIDYGSASAGGDYYSTVVYYTAAARGTTQVELPRERYYWDIVHMKLSDEFPSYIDPATGDRTDPPLGKFWREFLFTHSDSGYPILRDELAGVQVLWEGNMDSQVNGAVGVITGWVQDVLNFGSGAERPIQPVRIYRLHLGRCGEHADFTNATARAALIACNSPLTPDEDHTWNEFYDRRWVPWEPVNNYVDSGWHYEAWGKSLIGVFNWRGDDWIWDSVDRYTPHCTLTVAVTDSFGYPVDGTLVRVARKIGTPAYALSTWGYTNHAGIVDFLLGDENDLWVRFESEIGTFPSGSLYRKAAEASVAGEHYYYERGIFGERPLLQIVPGSYPTPPWDEYQVVLNWEVTGEQMYGKNLYNHNYFAEARDEGSITFFLCDSGNYAGYASADSFFAYEIHRDAGSGDVEFIYNTIDDWYAVVTNEEHLVNKQIVSVTADLYYREATAVAGGDAPARVALEGNRPNPFNPATTIRFTIPDEGRVDLTVYDVSGRLVKRLLSGTFPAGEKSAAWNGTDSNGNPVAAGVYFCRLEADGKQMHRKMVLVR